MRKILTNIKWFLLISVVVMLLLVVFRNLEQIEVELVVTTLRLPLAAWLSATLLIGFLLGLTTNWMWRLQQRRHARDKSEPAEQSRQ
ncbi:MAG: LapA family protein [bacterium]|nr:LapA family protein [bacterium]